MTKVGRREPVEDPAVRPIERSLNAVACKRSATGLVEDPPKAARAVWICPCVTLDDAPTWLIYESVDGGIFWCRVPNETEPLDLVEGALASGRHCEPSQVLAWLEGETSSLWWDDEDEGDAAVLNDLQRKIVNSASPSS